RGGRGRRRPGRTGDAARRRCVRRWWVSPGPGRGASRESCGGFSARGPARHYRVTLMPRRHAVLAVVVAVCWAVNFVVIDVGLESLPPLLFAALRFGLIAFP